MADIFLTLTTFSHKILKLGLIVSFQGIPCSHQSHGSEGDFAEVSPVSRTFCYKFMLVLFTPRNVSELETVQRAIHHIPELLDAAMAAMMEPNIQPPEVEVFKLQFQLSWHTVYAFPFKARMVALCLGVEHLAGLLQLLGGERRQEVLKEVRVVKDDVKEIRMIKERGQDDEEKRQGVIKDQLHVLSTQVGITSQGAKKYLIF